MRGVLITFEGVEGCGKSTQAGLLHDALRADGVSCVLSREPGGTPIGERIRDVLLDRQFAEMHAKTELLLYLASRNQHVRERLLPALASGAVVISDRYSESSLAYQGKARELTFRVVSRLDKFVTGGLRADMVVVVDVPPELGKSRLKDPPDRMESEVLKFHEKVRAGYRQLAGRAPRRIRIFDGRKGPTELHQEIHGAVRDLLNRKGIV